MSYKVLASDRFDKEIKRLIRKFPSLKQEYATLILSLETEPFQGIQIKPNCFKLRLSIASKGKGKSGGARVITYVYIREETVFLLTIYDKSETETISLKELDRLLREVED
jgi:mRNA-degrading endonuclease RelE of RelBE toxin-antitoxin system